MNVQIEQRKVAGVAIEASRILADKGFNRGEIILGLSELIGRTIVDSVQDTIQAEELMKIVGGHIAKTIDIGIQAAKGGKSSIITGV
jgi:hypothetical protein